MAVNSLPLGLIPQPYPCHSSLV